MLEGRHSLRYTGEGEQPVKEISDANKKGDDFGKGDEEAALRQADVDKIFGAGDIFAGDQPVPQIAFVHLF